MHPEDRRQIPVRNDNPAILLVGAGRFAAKGAARAARKGARAAKKMARKARKVNRKSQKVAAKTAQATQDYAQMTAAKDMTKAVKVVTKSGEEAALVSAPEFVSQATAVNLGTIFQEGAENTIHTVVPVVTEEIDYKAERQREKIERKIDRIQRKIEKYDQKAEEILASKVQKPTESRASKERSMTERKAVKMNAEVDRLEDKLNASIEYAIQEDAYDRKVQEMMDYLLDTDTRELTLAHNPATYATYNRKARAPKCTSSRRLRF